MSASGRTSFVVDAGDPCMKEWKTVSLYARFRLPLGFSEPRREFEELVFDAGESRTAAPNEWKTVWPKLKEWLLSCFEGVLDRNSPNTSGRSTVPSVSASEGISMALSSRCGRSLLMGMGGRSMSCERSKMLESLTGGKSLDDEASGGEKTSCSGGRTGVLLVALIRAPNEAGEGSLPLALALETSGVMTL